MNREIKFRGKRTYNNEWIYGSLIDNKFIFDKDYDNYDIYYDEEYGNGRLLEVDSKTIGQYTGLKDKNGVDVYEGDKVMFDYEWTEPDEIGVITWNKDTASFQIKGHIPSSSMKHLDRMKVIGNIYENEVD